MDAAPPFPAPAPSKEHTLRTPDGLALFAREYPAEAPVTGLPVLCLHGLTRNSRDFAGVAPRIAALGRRVICMDVRGRGRSDWDPKPENYQPVQYVQDTLRFLDQLEIPRCVWIGTSMGGLMTMIAAATGAAARMAGAVLNDIGPQIDAAGLTRIAGYVGKTEPVADLAAAAAMMRANNQHAFPNETQNDFWLQFAERTCRKRPDGRYEPDYDPAISRVFTQTQGAPAPDLWPHFAGLADVPTLVVRGAISDLLSAQTVAEMTQRKPDLKSVDVPDVGHAPTLEEEAAWTALWRFLAHLD
jgi:pimeloyl-ACP methyl ester carboxylesterase